MPAAGPGTRAAAQEPVLASAGGFKLRYAPGAGHDGAAEYTLKLEQGKEGRLTAVIAVDATRISRTALELSYPEGAYQVAEGEYGAWPGAGSDISRKIELDEPGKLCYVAQLSDAGPAAVSGAFELLRVVLVPVVTDAAHAALHKQGSGKAQ
jgi:hypothetical protein